MIMLPSVLDVVRPRSLRDLWRAWGKVRGKKIFCAGCTDLLVQAKDGHVAPAVWFDLSAIDELRDLRARNGGVWIGGGVTYAQVLDSPLLGKHATALCEAAYAFGSPQIRTTATVGGNVANASPAGDGIPPLLALDATAALSAGARKRSVPLRSFFRGVRRTVLRPGEIVLGLSVPKSRGRSTYYKLGTREAMSIAKVSLGLHAEPRAGRLRNVRIALGAVAPTVIRARRAEAALEGQAPNRDVLARAAQIVREEASPISDYRSDAAYRREECGFLLERAVRRLLDG